MQIYTLPDVTPNASVVNLGTAATSAGTPTRAVWVNMTASGTSIRYGDAAIGASRGQALPTGVPFLACPRGANDQTPYDLSKINVYGGSGSDNVSITYGY
jgi:hypothetical protein